MGKGETVSSANRFQYINSKRLGSVTLLDATMSDFSYVKHAHEEYSLGVTLKGRQDFFCQNAFHRSPAGGVLLFNPEDVHDGHSGVVEHLEYVMLYVHPDEFHPLFQALGYSSRSPLRVKTPLLNHAILRQQILMLRHTLSHSNHTIIEFEAGLIQIADSLIKLGGFTSTKADYVSRKDRLMLRAKDYILANLDQDIAIDDIAQAANMSKFHFIRLFRSQFGITPHQYVLNSRINLARRSLEAGLRASQVAVETGFCDSSHFNRHFKRIFGMTPKQYQSQLA
jgi:AraC-like DNA-binding protein